MSELKKRTLSVGHTDSGVTAVLRIEDLSVELLIKNRWVPAVDHLSLELFRNETVALVGESGSGKTLTSLSIIRLLPKGVSRVASGRILLGERDITHIPETAMEDVRGHEVAMIFQDPMSSLNPLISVGEQIAEVLRRHKGLSKAAARERALELMAELRIPDSDRRYSSLPHEFSGGQRQRIMIAAALAGDPKLIIADEPTTALDVTIQAQILLLLQDLRRDHGTAVLFITHNLAVVATIADRIAVLYAGQVVETGRTAKLFANARHPYTEGLLASIPRHDRDATVVRAIPGVAASLDSVPKGCRFAPRCPLKVDRCTAEMPRLVSLGDDPGHIVRCWVRAPS
jgi:peptide/nickel transport system ATP-binding protein